MKINNKNIESLITLVCEEFGIERFELFAKNKEINIVEARKAFYYILREEDMLTLQTIAKIANRDHTTVIHALESPLPLSKIRVILTKYKTFQTKPVNPVELLKNPESFEDFVINKSRNLTDSYSSLIDLHSSIGKFGLAIRNQLQSSQGKMNVRATASEVLENLIRTCEASGITLRDIMTEVVIGA